MRHYLGYNVPTNSQYAQMDSAFFSQPNFILEFFLILFFSLLVKVISNESPSQGLLILIEHSSILHALSSNLAIFVFISPNLCLVNIRVRCHDVTSQF